MDRQQILLGKVLESADLRLNVGTFDERLILQKAVYMLQSAGVHLGYRFRWYLRGPYSPDMTAGAFGIVGEGQSRRERNWVDGKLDDASKERAVYLLKPLLSGNPGDKACGVRRLELLASVLFLIKTEQAKATDAVETSSAILYRKYNKNFHADDASTGREGAKGVWPPRLRSRPARVVNDSIHGDIARTDDERRVVNTATFQRLRSLKQLGMGHLVYPNATHTRFAHSLGVFRIMCRVLERLNHPLTRRSSRTTCGLPRFLHDIGHYPYSHLMERVDWVKLTEEEIGFTAK